MSQQYSVEQFPASLDKIIQDVEQGNPVQITRQGQQVAVILSTAEYERLLNKKSSFSSGLKKIREELVTEGLEIDPDEIWGNLRDRSPGREVLL